MWEWAGKVVEVPRADLAHSLLPSRHSKAPAELSAPNQHSPGVSALVMLAEVHRPICYDSTVTPGMHPRRITQEVVFRPRRLGALPASCRAKSSTGRHVASAGHGPIIIEAARNSVRPTRKFFCPLAEVVGLALVSQPTDADKTAAL